jgi:hypothetical protein
MFKKGDLIRSKNPYGMMMYLRIIDVHDKVYAVQNRFGKQDLINKANLEASCELVDPKSKFMIGDVISDRNFVTYEVIDKVNLSENDVPHYKLKTLFAREEHIARRDASLIDKKFKLATDRAYLENLKNLLSRFDMGNKIEIELGDNGLSIVENDTVIMLDRKTTRKLKQLLLERVN